MFETVTDAMHLLDCVNSISVPGLWWHIMIMHLPGCVNSVSVLIFGGIGIGMTFMAQGLGGTVLQVLPWIPPSLRLSV